MTGGTIERVAPATLLDWYEQMVVIRGVEKAAHDLFMRGLLGATDHGHLLVPAEQGRRGHALDRLARHSPLPFAVFRCDWESRTVGSDPSTVQ